LGPWRAVAGIVSGIGEWTGSDSFARGAALLIQDSAKTLQGPPPRRALGVAGGLVSACGGPGSSAAFSRDRSHGAVGYGYPAAARRCSRAVRTREWPSVRTRREARTSSGDDDASDQDPGGIWECLDHVGVLNETHLRRLLRDYVAYYHSVRTHLSLEKDSPEPRPVERLDQGGVVEMAMVGGLHHRYARLAA
jgi:hypothetical protein